MADSNSNSKFKKGDRVRTRGYEGTHWDGEGVVTEEYDGFCILARINGREGGFAPHELAPAPLQLEAGKFYKTRDGRKVGPMRNEGWGDGEPWTADDSYRYYSNEGGRIEPKGEASDLIAEWVDEPKSTKEILDDLEAWMAEQDASRDNNPSPTTGFTVPLCAYEDAVTTTALGDAYVAGYKAGLAAAQQALAA